MKMKNRVLAVLALALLMINMVPVRRAEAAESFDYARGYELSFAYVSLIEDFIPVYYCVLTKDDYVTYLFFESIPSVTGQQYIYWANYGSTYLHYRVYKSDMRLERVNSGHIFYSFDEVSYCNFNVSNSSGEVFVSKFELPEPVIPDAEFDAYDRLGFIPQNVDAKYLLDGIWNITYSPSVTEYYMWYSVRVSIPPAIMVDSWEGKSPDDILSDDVIGEWRKGLSDFYDVTFDVLNVIPADSIQKKTTAGYFSLDIKSLIQERWSDLYPGVDEAMLDFIIAYAFPNVVVTRAFYIDYGSRVFGPANVARMAKFTSRIGGTNQEDILYALGSALEPVSGWLHGVGIQVGNKEEIDLNVALKEEIEQLKIERQSYLEEIAALESQIDNMVNGDSNSIFDTFSNIANGLKSMSGSVRNISIAVGNVFAFFPGEIITILFGGFVACIVIAVYKAIRG